MNNVGWPNFCQAIGEPVWCYDSKFADILQRLENVDELDRLVATWARQRTVDFVVKTLQQHGIAAGPSHDLKDLVGDESLFERGSLVRTIHPETGTKVGPGLPWRMSRVAPFHSAAPLLGQDTEYVFCDLLDMSTDEITTLSQEGAIN